MTCTEERARMAREARARRLSSLRAGIVGEGECFKNESEPVREGDVNATVSTRPMGYMGS